MSIPPFGDSRLGTDNLGEKPLGLKPFTPRYSREATVFQKADGKWYFKGFDGIEQGPFDVISIEPLNK